MVASRTCTQDNAPQNRSKRNKGRKSKSSNNDENSKEGINVYVQNWEEKETFGCGCEVRTYQCQTSSLLSPSRSRSSDMTMSMNGANLSWNLVTSALTMLMAARFTL